MALPTLASLQHNGTGFFTIPKFDSVTYTYIGATNNVDVQSFRLGGAAGTVVATLTYTYVNAGAADNDKIASVVMGV